MDTLRTIRLYGKLGAQFGRVHRLAVENTAEAIRALCALIPGFERELMTSRERGVSYAVFLGKNNINKDDLALSGGGDDIRIAPVLAGAKRGGVFQTILGAAMVFAGAAIAGFTAFTGWGAIGYKVGGWMMEAGAMMMLGGVVQILSPQQGKLSTADSPNNGASYVFNGAVNTQAQGNPVPALYGRMLVGSAVISAGITTEDQSYAGAVNPYDEIAHALDHFKSAF